MALVNSVNNRAREVELLPSFDYWRERLLCQGCFSPLIPPVFYCLNNNKLKNSPDGALGHALCKNCSRCNIQNCCSKAGTIRSFILERMLALASFTCQFQCRKGPFEPSGYNGHLAICHLRPLICTICKQLTHFYNYVTHLQLEHGMQKRELDKETLILDFSNNQQPPLQCVRFNNELFLVRFENYKLWFEYLGVDENAEVDYRVRLSGVKYVIDMELEVLAARNSEALIFGNFQPEFHEKDKNGNNINTVILNRNLFIVPPSDEELFILFICAFDDNESISSVEPDNETEDNNQVQDENDVENEIENDDEVEDGQDFVKLSSIPV